MVTCLRCSGLIDVRDRYCRWCGRTFILDNDVPPRPREINPPVICPKCHGEGWIDDPNYNGIGAILAQEIFHDDEEELKPGHELGRIPCDFPGCKSGILEDRLVNHRSR